MFFETNIVVGGGVPEQQIKDFFAYHVYYRDAFDKYLSELK
jgi:hypothetical protein